MMALQPATENVLSSDLENVGQGHHLQKLLYLAVSKLLYDLFLPNFYWNDDNVANNK